MKDLSHTKNKSYIISTYKGGSDSLNTSVEIKLGDAIKLIAPLNINLHNKIFLITYIDETVVDLYDIDTEMESSLSLNEMSQFNDESIQQIILLDSHPKKGYVKQNNLTENKWLDIEFRGDVRLVVTGVITNIFNDAIEIETYPEKHIIYIDFKYQGIPKDLNIVKITPRENPQPRAKQSVPPADSTVKESREKEEQEASAKSEESEASAKSEESEESAESEASESPADSVKSDTEIENNNAGILDEEQFEEILLEGEQIVLGEFNENINMDELFVDIPESEKVYNIISQADDLLDHMLSKIPVVEQTKAKQNKLHTIIERYVQLREQFSIFDINRNIIFHKQRGSEYKPLVELLKNNVKQIDWILPVVNHSKKLYGINSSELDQDMAYLPKDTAQVVSEEYNLFKDYKHHTVNNDINHYDYLYNQLNKIHTPFVFNPTVSDVYLQNNANEPLPVIVETGQNFNSLVYSSNGSLKNNLTGDSNEGEVVSKRFVIDKLTTGYNRLKPDINGVYSRKNISDNDPIAFKSFLILPEEAMNLSRVKLPKTNILIKSLLADSILHKWELLNNNTHVSSQNIDETDYINYEDENFLKTISEYVLKNSNNNKENYTNYLNAIIPKTRRLIRMVKNYSDFTLNLNSFVDYLEPFYIGIDDISFKQYTEINLIIKDYIRNYIRNLLKNQAELQKTMRYNYSRINPMSVSDKKSLLVKITNNIPDITEQNIENLFKLYEINDVGIFSSSELIRKTKLIDNSVLYNTALSSKNSEMISSDAIYDILEQEKNKLLSINTPEEIKKENGQCLNRVKLIAKEYSTLDAALRDNYSDIYFDKKFDPTKYELLNEIKLDEDKSREENIDILAGYISKKFKLEMAQSRVEASHIYSNRRRVVAGDYAQIMIMQRGGSNTEMSNSPEDESKSSVGSNVSDLNDLYIYLKRNDKNEWQQDNDAKPSDFHNDKQLSCDLLYNCVSIEQDSPCVTSDIQNNLLYENDIDKLINEFNNNDGRLPYLIEQNTRLFKSSLNNLTKFIELKNLISRRQNNMLLIMGLRNKQSSEAEKERSPYLKLLTRIMSHPDHIEKQNYIVQFVNNCTLTSNNVYKNISEEKLPETTTPSSPSTVGGGETKESESDGSIPQSKQVNDESIQHWYLCKKTKQKLLPRFLYDLARCFVDHGPRKYSAMIEHMANTNGVPSDDRSAIVDINTGYIIKNIEFQDVDEYTDSGYKITTHSLIDKDILDVDFNEEKDDDYENLTAIQNPTVRDVDESKLPELHRQSKSIIDALAVNLYIDNPEVYYEFVFTMVTIIYKDNISTIDKLAKLMVRKLKASKSVKADTVGKGNIEKIKKAIKASFILEATVCLLHLSLQTSIPSIKIKKTFPGCLRSFTGFPSNLININEFSTIDFDNVDDEDMNSLVYFACVIKSTSTKTPPWNNYGNSQITKITDKLFNFYKKYILKYQQVTVKIQNKQEWLRENPHDSSDEELDANMWINMLPPLTPSNIPDTRTPTVGQGFFNTFNSNLQSGNLSQFNQLLTLKTKFLDLSISIQHMIQEILEEETPALMTATEVPFTENACCSEKQINNLQYFIDKNPDLLNKISISNNYKKELDKYIRLTAPFTLYNNENTRALSTSRKNFLSESTIYKLFISVCNFTNNRPIPTVYAPLCSTKPESLLPKNESIYSQLRLLKEQGYNYSQEDAIALIKIINNKNIVSTNKSCSSKSAFNLIELYAESGSSEVFNSFDVYVNNFNTERNARGDRAREDDADNRKPLFFIQLLKTYIDTFDPEIDKTDLDADIITDYLYNRIDYLTVENHNFVASHYKKINISGKAANKLVKYFKNILDWDNDTNINHNSFIFIKNVLYYLCEYLPNIILSTHDYASNKLPKHWNLSSRHYKELVKSIGGFYCNISEKLYNLPFIKQYIRKIKDDLHEIYKLVVLIPLYESDRTDSNKSLLFDTSVTTPLFNFFFQLVIWKYLHMSEPLSIESAPIDTDMTTSEVNEIFIQDIDNDNIVKIKLQVISLFYDIIKKYKSSVLYTVESIQEKILKQSEREKSKKTEHLKNLTNDEMEVERLMKQNKLGQWGVGLQKGMTQYVKETYDSEMAAIDKDEFISDPAELADINEANDITHLADDDDYGDDSDLYF